jgi:hypothetical protein
MREYFRHEMRVSLKTPIDSRLRQLSRSSNNSRPAFVSDQFGLPEQGKSPSEIPPARHRVGVEATLKFGIVSAIDTA